MQQGTTVVAPGLDTSSENVPLLVDDTLFDSYQQVNQIIERSKESSDSEETQPEHPFWAYLKCLLAVLLLVTRVLSCLFRYVTLKDMMQFLTDSAGWIEVIASIFAITDMIMTVFGTQKSVFKLCLTPNWFQQACDGFGDCRKKYPFWLVLLTLLALPGPWLKGKVGVLSITDRIEQENVGFVVLAHFVGVCSSICFFAFQINRQALRVIRTRENLNSPENKVIWDDFCQREKWLLIESKVVGCLLGMLNAVMTGTSVFYNAGKFEINWKSGLYFSTMAIPTSVINAYCGSNHNYLYWLIQDKYQTLLAQRTVSRAAAAKDESFSLKIFIIKVIGAIAALGACFALGPSIIHLLMLMTRTNNISGGHYCVGIFGALLTAAMIKPVFSREYTMWVRTGLADMKKSMVLSSQQIQASALVQPVV